MIYPEFQNKIPLVLYVGSSFVSVRMGETNIFQNNSLHFTKIQYFSKIILCISQISRQWEIAERGQRDCFMGPRSGRDQVRCYFQEEVNISNKNVNFCWTVDKNVNFCWIVDKEKAIMAGSGKMLLSERKNQV